MAAQDSIGDVTKITMVTTNAQSETILTEITTNYIVVNPDATYSIVDTGQRALANLLTDTYSDTKLLTTYSVKQIMDEEG